MTPIAVNTPFPEYGLASTREVNQSVWGNDDRCFTPSI